jgi:hypothetical protein
MGYGKKISMLCIFSWPMLQIMPAMNDTVAPVYSVKSIKTDYSNPFYTYLPWPWTQKKTMAKFTITLEKPGWQIRKYELKITKRKPVEAEMQILHAAYPELSVEQMKSRFEYSVKMGYREKDTDWNWLKNLDVENIEIQLEFSACACQETELTESVSYTTGDWGLNLVNYQIKDKQALIHWWRTK